MYTVNGFKVQSSAAVFSISANTCAQIFITGTNFGSLSTLTNTAHIVANNYGIVVLAGNYTISGQAGFHYDCGSAGGTIAVSGAVAITLTGTPAFTTFAQCALNGVINIPSGQLTYSGSATGQRYGANLGGIINTSGGGASYFPGNSAGTNNSGSGQYA
jgi:hypothetical protein